MSCAVISVPTAPELFPCGSFGQVMFVMPRGPNKCASAYACADIPVACVSTTDIKWEEPVSYANAVPGSRASGRLMMAFAQSADLAQEKSLVASSLGQPADIVNSCRRVIEPTRGSVVDVTSPAGRN